MILVKNGLNITQKMLLARLHYFLKRHQTGIAISKLHLGFVSPYCKIPIVNSTFGPNHVQVNIEKKK